MNIELEKIGRFEIWGAWAPEIAEAIKPILRDYEPLLPSWCHVAHVAFRKEESAASCGVDFEYRMIRLAFGPGFFDKTDAERRLIFIHEMMHGYAHHLHNVAFDLLGDALGGSENLALTLARKQLREANEGITCDLTLLVSKLLSQRSENEGAKMKERK